MITDTTKLWDMFAPSLRPDQVLCLFRLALEPDDDSDAGSEIDWCGVPSDTDLQQEASDQEKATRAKATG